MITYEQATASDLNSARTPDGHTIWESYVHSEFHMLGFKNADGTPVRWRRNGKTKTWKTRPGEFKIPVKQGIHIHGYVTHENAHEFSLGFGLGPS